MLNQHLQDVGDGVRWERRVLHGLAMSGLLHRLGTGVPDATGWGNARRGMRQQLLQSQWRHLHLAVGVLLWHLRCDWPLRDAAQLSAQRRYVRWLQRLLHWAGV